MKLAAPLLAILLITSCIQRNLSSENNWATNKDYKAKYKNERPKSPIQNIPYVITYVEQNPKYKDNYTKLQASNDARYSYNYYQEEINEMRNVMNTVNSNVTKIAIADNPNIRYIYDKELGEYVIDPESINKKIDIPDLDGRYEVNQEMNFASQIPYKNAYAILQMKSKGQVPNEIYFKNMNVKNPINHKFDIYDRPKEIKRSGKFDIYTLAGLGISELANKVYNE